MPDDQLKFELKLSTGPDNGLGLEALHRDVRCVKEGIAAILENLPIQRRPLSESTRLLHAKAIWQRRSGFCPCCQRVAVCGEQGKLPGAEFDHFYARHRNGALETWLVCQECNRRLETTDFKTAARSAFEAYQQALRPFLDCGQGTFQ